jgi:hypothetical protein
VIRRHGDEVGLYNIICCTLTGRSLVTFERYTQIFWKNPMDDILDLVHRKFLGVLESRSRKNLETSS